MERDTFQPGVEPVTLRTTAERKEKKILLVDLGGVMGGVEYYIETLSGMLMERAYPSGALRAPGVGAAVTKQGDVKSFRFQPFAG